MPLSRSASLVIFPLGLVGSFGWAWWQLDLFAQNVSGFKCGLPIFGIYGVAVVGVGFTSLLSAALNIVSFRAFTKPRSALRILELVALAAPSLLAAVLIGVIIYAS